MPVGKVDLVFPFSGEVSSGRVVAWSPVDDGDVAVIACDMPDQVRPIPLFQLPLTRSHRFRAFGFPKGYASGRWGYGELLDAVPGGMIQAASSDLAPGFSGGPVEELQMARLIGVLTSYDPQLDGWGLFGAAAGHLCRWYFGQRAVPCLHPFAACRFVGRPVGNLRRIANPPALWGSQSWLQPAFSRL